MKSWILPFPWGGPFPESMESASLVALLARNVAPDWVSVSGPGSCVPQVGESKFQKTTIVASVVAPGERVVAGQRLAQVGHSGNSTAPHLHFQLMDGPDYLTAMRNSDLGPFHALRTYPFFLAPIIAWLGRTRADHRGRRLVYSRMPRPRQFQMSTTSRSDRSSDR